MYITPKLIVIASTLIVFFLSTSVIYSAYIRQRYLQNKITPTTQNVSIDTKLAIDKPSPSPYVSKDIAPNVFNGDLRSLPTTTPMPVTEPKIIHGLKITTTKTSYHKNETIEVIIENTGSEEITYYSGGCSEIVFEFQTDGQWKPQKITKVLETAEACGPAILRSNSRIIINSIINADPSAGIYRVNFPYRGGNAYSPRFMIN